jgi:hypothetical protein
MSLLVMKEAFNVLKDHRKRDDEFMTRQAKSNPRFDNAIAALRQAICEAESQAPRLAYIKNDSAKLKNLFGKATRSMMMVVLTNHFIPSLFTSATLLHRAIETKL